MTLIDDPGWGGGFIADWLLCGPFYYGYSDRPADGTLPHDDDYLQHPEGEGNVRPLAGDTVTTAEGTWRWEARHSAAIRMNITQELGPGPFLGRHLIMFAATYVVFDKACTGLLWLGTSDGYRLYVNGRELHDIQLMNRVTAPDQNVYKIKWRRGRNLILLRMRSNRGGCELMARLTDEHRVPLKPRIELLRQPTYQPAPGSLQSGPGCRVLHDAPIPGDWRPIPVSSFRGGSRPAAGFSGLLSSSHSRLLKDGETAAATFDLAGGVPGKTLLVFEALNSNAVLSIIINDRAIWEGTPPQLPAGVPKKAFGHRIFLRSHVVLPTGALRDGANTVQLSISGHGCGAWLAFRSVAVLAAEALDSHAGWSAVRFAGERFGSVARPRWKPDNGDWPQVGGHCFVSAKYLAEIPASGEIRAWFRLPRLNRRTPLEFTLELRPLQYCWPWIGNDPRDGHSDLPSPYAIEINGVRVNAVRRPALNVQQGIYAGLILPVPAEAVRAGLNELLIRVIDPTGASVFASGSGQVPWQPGSIAVGRPFIEEVVVRWRPRPIVPGVPRVAHVDRPFEVGIDMPEGDRLISMALPAGLVCLNKIPAAVGPGESTLQFNATRPAASGHATIRFSNRTLKVRMPRIVDGVDPNAMNFIVITALDAPADDLDGHARMITAIKRDELGNTVHFRNRMPAAAPAATMRELIRLHRDADLYLSWSWGPFLEGPANKYTVADVQRWGGRHIAATGSAREEPPIARYANLLELHNAYLAYLLDFYGNHPGYAGHPSQAWSRYSAAAGASVIWVQEGYCNFEWQQGSMRGAARAYELPMGVSNCDDCAVLYWDDERALRIASLHNWIAYFSGCTWLMPEISGRYMRGRTLPGHGGYLADPVNRARFEIEMNFYDFIRTRSCPGLPLAPLGIVQGRLDGWDGFADWQPGPDENGYQQGFYEPGRNLWRSTRTEVLDRRTSYWPYGIAEAGWRYLDVVMPRIGFGTSYPAEHPQSDRHWFCGTPYGKVDLVPGDLVDTGKWQAYRALIFLGWNSATDEQYDALRTYVENGGILLMTTPQLTTSVVHGVTSPLVKRGNWSDLFGVRVSGKTKALGTRAVRTRQGAALLKRRGYALNNHWRNPLRAPRIRLIDDAVVLARTNDHTPLLVERKLGRGRAILLTAWNFPGEEAFEDLYRDLIDSIAAEVTPPVRIEPTDYVNHGVFVTADGEPGRDFTTIFFTDTRWWEMAASELDITVWLDGNGFPLRVPPATIRSVAWHGKVAVTAEDPMIYVTAIDGDPDGPVRIRAQGSGRSRMTIFFLAGRPEQIRVCRRTVPFDWDAGARIASIDVKWRGENEIEVFLAAD